MRALSSASVLFLTKSACEPVIRRISARSWCSSRCQSTTDAPTVRKPTANGIHMLRAPLLAIYSGASLINTPSNQHGNREHGDYAPAFRVFIPTLVDGD